MIITRKENEVTIDGKNSIVFTKNETAAIELIGTANVPKLNLINWFVHSIHDGFKSKMKATFSCTYILIKFIWRGKRW